MTSTETDTHHDLHNPIYREFWTRDEQSIDADLAELRAQPPQFLPEPDGSELGLPSPGSWVVTRYDQILEMSKTPEIYSSANGVTVIDSPPEFNEYFSSMISMDDPRHAHLRKLVSAGFTPRMLAKLEDIVQAQASTIVDDVSERGTCDFVVDVAARLPLKIVCDLMGVPDSQIDFVFDQTNVILGVSDPEYGGLDDDPLSLLLNAGDGLSQLMYEVADSKVGSDSDDLTTMLVNAEVDGEKLSQQDIASFFILLVVAGNETTRNAISWGLKYLTDNPDQRKIWTDDFERVGPGAVEEIVRLASPVTYMRRTATQDVELGGAKIAAGDKLCMFYLAANRDEDHFDDPYAFNVLRDPNRHLGFGGPGPHFCMGAHLARREILVMFRELFERIPDIAATGPPDLLSASFIHGIKHLDASFTRSSCSIETN
ncbi:MAG: cytochrome P450 [Acidimicrobiales bacterium]